MKRKAAEQSPAQELAAIEDFYASVPKGRFDRLDALAQKIVAKGR